MKYLKGTWDEGGDDPMEGTTYFEVDDDDGAWRQITMNKTGYYASNVYYDDKLKELPLADQPVYPVEDTVESDVEYIEKDEFEKVWSQHLASRLPQWNVTKQKYPLGKEVNGISLVFYPQGLIVEVAKDVLGVANFDEYRAKRPTEISSVGEAISARVAGFDDINQWLRLEIMSITSTR